MRQVRPLPHLGLASPWAIRVCSWNTMPKLLLEQHGEKTDDWFEFQMPQAWDRFISPLVGTKPKKLWKHATMFLAWTWSCDKQNFVLSWVKTNIAKNKGQRKLPRCSCTPSWFFLFLAGIVAKRGSVLLHCGVFYCWQRNLSHSFRSATCYLQAAILHYFNTHYSRR